MGKKIYVSLEGSTWKLHWEGEMTGSQFRNEDDAISEAKEKISQLPRGAVSEIRVQRITGIFTVEWSYRRDLFPKR